MEAAWRALDSSDADMSCDSDDADDKEELLDELQKEDRGGKRSSMPTSACVTRCSPLTVLRGESFSGGSVMCDTTAVSRYTAFVARLATSPRSRAACADSSNCARRSSESMRVTVTFEPSAASAEVAGSALVACADEEEDEDEDEQDEDNDEGGEEREDDDDVDDDDVDGEL